jgi:hypothetical protein
MRILVGVLIVCFLSLTALVSQQHSAQAGAYDDQCKASGGSALQWDGVGLRWCCVKYNKHIVNFARKQTLWCKR